MNFKEFFSKDIMKLVKFILGALFVICAVVTFIFPFETEIIYAYIVSIFAGLYGAFKVVEYILKTRKAKKEGAVVDVSVGGAVLGLSIANIILMIFNITIPGFTLAAEYIAALFLLFMLLVEGIFTVIGVLAFHEYDFAFKIAVLSLGGVMILAAVLGLAFVPGFIASIGIIIGIGLLISGANLILSAFRK